MKVAYVGHMGKFSGYAVAAEHHVRALVAAGVQVVLRPLPGFNPTYMASLHADLEDRIGMPLATTTKDADAVIVHDLPLAMAGHAELLSDVGTGRRIPVVGYTTWEAQTMQPEVATKLLAHVDELWMPNSAGPALFHRHKRETASGVPVAAIPHPYDPDNVPVRREPQKGYYTFSWWGHQSMRKNPVGLVRAFCHAFRPSDPVKLHIHSAQMERGVALAMLGMTGLEQKDMPLIEFSAQQTPLTDLVGDCYVTAARGEAWNLPAFEAMTMGAHVISPQWLGSDDFLAGTTAAKYATTFAPASCDVSIGDGGAVTVNGAQGLTARDMWIEPDLLSLVAYMKAAVRLGTRTITTKYNLADRYSYQTVGRMMRDRLENLVGRNTN